MGVIAFTNRKTCWERWARLKPLHRTKTLRRGEAGRGPAGEAAGEAKASTQNQDAEAWRRGVAWRDLSGFIERYREIMEAVDEAKASTQNQDAEARRGGRRDGYNLRIERFRILIIIINEKDE